MLKTGRCGSFCLALVFCFVSAIVSQAQTFTSLHSFNGTDGFPSFVTVEGADGDFYGTTSEGGLYGFGTVFKITPAGGLSTIYDFCHDASCSDGAYPNSELIQGADGNFYGTTENGGAYNRPTCGNGCGTVFQITPAGDLTTLYSFCMLSNCADGASPFAGVSEGADGNFYGTTTSGGSACGGDGCGTVFKITPKGALSTIHSFDLVDGLEPNSQLELGSNGSFYGTTLAGGAGTETSGTIFEITTSGALTTLHTFCPVNGTCPDGEISYGKLLQASDGNFYGTTSTHGPNEEGTVFKITPGGAFTTIYGFCSRSRCLDGGAPLAGLVQGTDGSLYGTTSYGGAISRGTSTSGTVYKITTTGELTTLYSFCSQTNCTDGAIPSAGLVLASSGTFYGTTTRGGTFDSCNAANGLVTCGTVFSLSPNVALAPSFSPASLVFAKLPLSTTSASKIVTVTNVNTGAATLDINSVTASSDFAISSTTCGLTLAAGKQCKVYVSFTPTTLGFISGTLSIADNAPGSPQSVALSGAGEEPVTVMPARATYAKQKVGITSAAKNFSLKNYLSTAIPIASISATGDFAVSTTTCSTSLAARSVCTIAVTFTPTATGTRTGQLTVQDGASNSPQTATLTGTGQ
jgi:uncharacterized repeat protein (TIGR03803 family)